MLQYDVNAKVRTAFGKGAARRMRSAKITPAVLYGHKVDNVALELDSKSMTKTLMEIQGQNAVLTLNIDGVDERPTRHVMVQEVQVDPVRDTLVHSDFLEVNLEKPLTLSVPVVFTGKAKGVDMGGEVIYNKTSVLLKGLVLDIPDNVTIDISELNLNDSLQIKDLEIPANVTLEDEEEITCVSVLTARVLSDEEGEEVEEAEESIESEQE